MNIRIANALDAGSLIEFNQAMALETEGKRLDPEKISSGVAAVFADEKKGFYVVAEDSGAIVGGLMVTYEWSDWRNGWFWWIQSVYVRAEQRGRGVFRRLYEHVAATARREPDVIGLRLYVDAANGVAQQVYRKLGMTATGYRLLERYPL